MEDGVDLRQYAARMETAMLWGKCWIVRSKQGALGAVEGSREQSQASREGKVEQ